jgi:glucose-1-phosphate adenylyltransferase
VEKTLAMLLAGGQGSRLNILASHRAKPAVPFAGIYRIIDFTLSNIANSDITNVGILTQYRPSSLIDHIQTGESWGFYGRNRSAIVLPPYKGEDESSWYEGTADAIFQNISYINHFDDIKHILIASGDHIYKMNYNDLLSAHKKNKADLTVVAMNVPKSEASRFGTIIVDKNDRVIDFEEKPVNPKSTLASLGIYLFNKDVLLEELKKDSLNEKSSRDFGKDIVSGMVKKRVFIYRFNGYWKDVGTIESYWETSMNFLFNRTGESDLTKWQIRTNLNRKIEADRKPTYLGKKSNIVNSLISDGCVINGTVINSILSPGVIVEEGTVIKDSIIFHDTHIKHNCNIDRCVIDKDVVINNDVFMGKGNLKAQSNIMFPKHLYTGITIVGKAAIVPARSIIGRNCILYPSLKISDFKKKSYASGETIQQIT